MKVPAAGMVAWVLLLASAGAAGPQPPPRQPTGQPVLVSSGLPRGAPEDVLPAGAVLHIRLNNAANLIDTLDGLIMSFVPEKAVPPPMRLLLQQEKPVLAFLGAQTIRQPLTLKMISMMLGVALDRPVSLTFYPADPGRGFVLALPMQNPAALTGLILNVLRPREFRQFRLAGAPAFRVVATNPNLPRRLTIVCSEDTAYLCGSRKIAGQLLSRPGANPLSASPLVLRALREYGRQDLFVALDAGFAKALLPMVAQYGQIPPDMIEKLRSQVLNSIPAHRRTRMELRLRLQFGIRDLAQLLDYAECFATSMYEILFQELHDQFMAFDGLVLSLDIGERFQRATFAAYSAKLDPERFTRPIPMDAVRKALAQVPGTSDALSVSGRMPPPEKSKLVDAWFALLKAKMRGKGLEFEGVDRYLAYRRSVRSPAPLASKLPWRVTTTAAAPGEAPRNAASLLGYLEALGKQLQQGAYSAITVIPRQEDRFLEKHFSGEAKQENDNVAAERALLAKTGDKPGFYEKVSRFRVETLPGSGFWPVVGPLETFIREDVYITRGGIFGYNQHELINRRIFLSRTVGAYRYLQQQGPGDRWLREIGRPSAQPLSPAVETLLALTPEQCNTIKTVRLLHRLMDLVEILVQIEAAAHTELDAFLTQARKVFDAHPGNPDAAVNQLLKEDVPLPMLTLNRDARTGRLYCVLLGKLHYPRPRIAPILKDLLKDYATRMDTVGGGALFVRVLPGKYEVTCVQSTEALALLVKTTVNRFFEKYMAGPDGMKRLMRQIAMPFDGKLRLEEALISNTLWDMFLEESIQGNGFAPQ